MVLSDSVAPSIGLKVEVKHYVKILHFCVVRDLCLLVCKFHHDMYQYCQ